MKIKKKTNEIKIKQKNMKKNHSLQYRTMNEKQKQEALQIKRELKSMKDQLKQIKKTWDEQYDKLEEKYEKQGLKIGFFR